MVQKYSIGRNPENQIVIQHPAVSGMHADLIVNTEDGYSQYYFTDHSTNGTYINGQLLHDASCYVAFNDTIIFPGNILFDWNCLGNSNFVTPHSESVLNTPASMPAGSGAAFSGSSFNRDSSEVERITFSNVLGHFFRHYTDFSGRASRREYWLIVLWSVIVYGLIITVSAISIGVGIASDFYSGGLASSAVGIIVLILSGVLGLATFIPSLALTFRRIHDTGRESWFFFLSFIPLVGFVFPWIWALSDSQPGTNNWGPCPK